MAWDIYDRACNAVFNCLVTEGQIPPTIAIVNAGAFKVTDMAFVTSDEDDPDVLDAHASLLAQRIYYAIWRAGFTSFKRPKTSWEDFLGELDGTLRDTTATTANIADLVNNYFQWVPAAITPAAAGNA